MSTSPRCYVLFPRPIFQSESLFTFVDSQSLLHLVRQFLKLFAPCRPILEAPRQSILEAAR